MASAQSWLDPGTCREEREEFVRLTNKWMAEAAQKAAGREKAKQSKRRIASGRLSALLKTEGEPK